MIMAMVITSDLIPQQKRGQFMGPCAAQVLGLTQQGSSACSWRSRNCSGPWSEARWRTLAIGCGGVDFVPLTF